MRVISATVLTFFALAAPALADDPLLSGYSGPGGLDQSLLGGGLVGGGGGSSSGGTKGGGSLRASAPAVARPAPGAEGTVADVSTAPRLTRAPSVAAASTATKQPTGSAPASAGTSSAATSATPTGPEKASAHTPATQRTSATDGGSAFPVSATDLLLLLLGAAALLGVARATARLGGPAVPST